MDMDRELTKNLSLISSVKSAYQAGQEDEVLEPIIAVDLSDRPLGRFEQEDYVVFYNIRGEREVELTESLINRDFNHFPQKKDLRLNFVTMIEYSSSLKVRVAFPPEGKIKNTLAEVLSKAGMKLLKISESEKAVHVGFFMNCKNDETFPGEKRIIVPSPQDVSSYALKPEMSASQVAREISSNLRNPTYRIIVASLANVDVVGHVENKAAVIQAIEEVDRQLERIIDDCRSQGITLVVASDHGTDKNPISVCNCRQIRVWGR